MPSPRAERDSGALPGQLQGVLEPHVTAAGFDLEEVDVKVAGRRHTVRLVVDSDTGIDLDAVASLARSAGAALTEHEHLIPGAYTLEVTSPGAERPLVLPRHWRRARLRKVAVRLAGGGALTGRVGDAGDEAVTLLVDGALRELPYADVAHAAVEIEFKKPPASEVEQLGGTPDTEPDEIGEDA